MLEPLQSSVAHFENLKGSDKEEKRIFCKKFIFFFSKSVKLILT